MLYISVVSGHDLNYKFCNLTCNKNHFPQTPLSSVRATESQNAKLPVNHKCVTDLNLWSIWWWWFL